MLDAHGARLDRIRLHIVPTDRVWLRDSAPIGVRDAANGVVLLDWKFNAWAKYDNWSLDDRVGTAVASITGLRREEPRWQNGERIVLEGGGIEIYLAVTFLYFVSAFTINRIAQFIERRVQVPGMIGASK